MTDGLERTEVTLRHQKLCRQYEEFSDSLKLISLTMNKSFSQPGAGIPEPGQRGRTAR